MNLEFKITIHKPSKKLQAGKKAKGVVIEDDKGNLRVSIDTDKNGVKPPIILPFTPDSYELKGKQDVFLKKLDEKGRRIRIHRSLEDAKFFPGLPSQHTPIAKGWLVEGIIVKDGLLKMFKFERLLNVDGYNQIKRRPR